MTTMVRVLFDTMSILGWTAFALLGAAIFRNAVLAERPVRQTIGLEQSNRWVSTHRRT